MPARTGSRTTSGDATAGGRIYGKKVNFSEAFTGGGWQDHPFALKAMGDHHYTEGVNRMMLHVWNEQYVPTRAPGVPGAGTPFNHTNTWWKAGQPWRDYMKKAQALLQEGDPVADILYFAGENIPCRSILHPKHGSAWAADPAPPDGFMHDTINRDGLLRLTTVQNGRIVVNSDAELPRAGAARQRAVLDAEGGGEAEGTRRSGSRGGRAQADLLAQPGTGCRGAGGGQAGRRRSSGATSTARRSPRTASARAACSGASR